MRFRTHVPLLLVAALAAGCGDSTGPADTGMTQAEARDLALALASNSVAASTPSAARAPDSGARLDLAPAAPRFDGFSVDNSVACPLGGQLSVTGSAESTPGEEETVTTFDFTGVHHDCVVSTEKRQYTINGDPSIQLDGSLRTLGFRPVSLHIAETGGFRWTTPGAQGDCSLDFITDVDWGDPHTVHVQGTICGFAVDVTRTLQG